MKLRAAVIGVGYLGNFHAQKYKALAEGEFKDQLELVGVCDVHTPQADLIAASLGVRSFHRPQDLLGQVDLVTIATVTSQHFEVAQLFLQNRVHVNVEKPMTVTTEQARELVALAKKMGVTLCVGQSERFNPVITEIRSRAIDIQSLELHRHAPYKSRGADVSVIHDLMIHDLDLAVFLLGGRPKVVSAKAGRLLSPSWDWARCELSFPNGKSAFISVSRMAAAMTRSVRVFASPRVYEGNLGTGDLTTIQLKSQDIQQPPEVLVHNCGKGDNLLLETVAFLRAVRGDAQPLVSGEDGCLAVELVDQVLALL